jgi:2-hydroxy-6-oxo-6-(2'-aminophenyl)hexa-2,4-dienoate hydrolase
MENYMGDFTDAKGKFESRYVDAGGIKTHYLEAGSGHPLIVIHGGGAGADSLSNWFRCIPSYAKKFRVIAVDMLGFGKTDKPDPERFQYTQDARNKHMAAFIEALGLKGTHLIGNSMGGSTSIGVSVERPELVDRVVLMGSAGLNSKFNPALLPIVNYDFTREGMVKVCKTLANPAFRIDDDMVDYRFESSIAPDTRKGYSATMGWVKQQGGLFYPEDFIRRLKRPTLVVNGKKDLVVPLDNAYRFLELIENSWGYIIPDCGHWAMLEYPQDFISETMRFLETPST